MTPAHLIMGLVGNITLLAALLKESKAEKAYVYQVLITISKTLGLATFSIYMVFLKVLVKYDFDGIEWFRRIYAVNFYVAYIGMPLGICFATTTSILSLAMSLDRVLALTKPFQYRNLNHKLYHCIISVVAIFIGIFFSAS